MFNEALEAVADELGTEQVRTYYYSAYRIIPKSKRRGGNPPTDEVGRDMLIADIDQVLKLLGVDD
jgi:hypothetical protein